ncbi:CPBP family intramembrane glutamic endopeptidase [Cohnella thailandensis]|jgi:Predicted metal-dependent membrane protease|uniref:CPBP family intramembrane metalloprotease n=1 Tax=Cohnella thailandensis TaxID=557557 RepID=A0A841SSV3_9BACL|nr:type II CAAX endopeptidase family protein [Cohnella thailandensis]MBB6635423.1 CPBP family intramembrane metalloprotease [Cohnella thailandensis]MBP1974803.1 membrane protease YdiL (CAAX protease family) [Cohnella thailandensis]
MKKFNIRNVKVRKVDIGQLDDRLLLINLYLTQLITFIIGFLWVIFQGRSVINLFRFNDSLDFLYWGAGLAALIVLFEIAVSRWVPEQAMDDGGVNEKMFKKRPIWHIVVICLIVSICEELLFRGAIQYAVGAYWTSILFAAIHVRYLKHWIPTGMVFGISYSLGWIQEHTGTIWAPIAAHFAFDLIMGLIIRFRKEAER